MGSTATLRDHHYEIATYGTVCTYASVLGEREVSAPLLQTLKEEKAADKKLTSIAKKSVNRRASKEWHERATDSMLEKSARWVGMTAGRVVSRVMPQALASDTRAADSRPSGARTKAAARKK